MRRMVPVIHLFSLMAVLALLTACSVGRDYQATLVMSDIAAGKAPSKLKSRTAKPTRTAVTFPAGGRTVAGDLYLSDPKPSAGILVLPGAAEKGKDDPRLQSFANSLSRAGFAVLVPDLEGVRTLRLTSADIAQAVDAFSWLVSRHDLAPQGRAGMVSFSYASGPAILAALDPRISSRVKFIMAVGGYHDLNNVLTFFTTGYYREDGRWLHREPNSYGKWVFVLSNLHRLPDPGDRLVFQEAAQRKLANLNASLHDLVPRLTPEGRTLYDFLENRDPARARSLIDRLPAAIRAEIRALDVAGHDLTLLKARMILIHGYDDDIIPYTESVALARSVPPGRAQLYLVHGLHHVNLKPGMMDKLRLWRAIAALLREREER